MIIPLDCNLGLIDEYPEELAALVEDARKGEISQLLWRVSDFGGKDATWTAEDVLCDIEALLLLVLKPIATPKEVFGVTVKHVRRATFVVELTAKIETGKKTPPKTKKARPDHLTSVWSDHHPFPAPARFIVTGAASFLD